MDIRNTPFWNLLMISGLASSGGLIEDSATGNPVVFDTDVAKPLQKLSLSLLPRQAGSGDPSPENVRDLIPWGNVGTWHGGSNTWDEQWEVGTISIETGENVVANDRIRAKNYNPCVPNKTYFIVDPTHGKNIRLFYYDREKNFVGDSSWKDGEITTPSNAYFFRFIVASSYGTAYKNDIAINYPSSVTTYSPSAITPHPVNLQKNLFDPSAVIRRNRYLLNDEGVEQKTSSSGYTLNRTKVESGKTYTISGTIVNGSESCRLYFYSGDTFVSRTIGITSKYIPKTFTVPDGCDGVALQYNLVTTDFSSIQIEEGEEASAFQPYIPSVYGCEIDLVTGEVWGIVSEPVMAKDIPFYIVSDGVFAFQKNYDGQHRERIACTAYKTVTFTYWNQMNDLEIMGVDNGTIFRIRDDRFTTETDFRNYLTQAEVEICLPSAPVLLAILDPQQIESMIGTNTIWTDGDNVDVTFLKKK